MVLEDGQFDSLTTAALKDEVDVSSGAAVWYITKLPELLSVSEVAQRRGVSRQAVLQRIESGKLPARRVGSIWAIPAVAAA